MHNKVSHQHIQREKAVMHGKRTTANGIFGRLNNKSTRRRFSHWDLIINAQYIILNIY
jgi:hypothetical protein